MEEVDRHHLRLQDEAYFGYLDSLVFDLVKPRRITTPVMVMGAKDDQVIHPAEVIATAKAYGVEPTLFEGVAHDMMLDTRWRNVANGIIERLGAQFQERSPSLALHTAA
jgi:pimeloyl-ACP methyl ester carboxylesterase